MKKNVFMYVSNDKLINEKVEFIPKMNKGLGGTDFAYLSLAFYVNKISNFNLTLFSKSKFSLETIKLIKVNTINEVILECQEKKSLLILNHGDLLLPGTESPNLDLINKFEDLKIRIILICHNHIKYKFAKVVANSPSIVLNVFVGKQFYDYYYDHKIILKSTFMYNLSPLHTQKRSLETDKKNDIVFLAGITPNSGFHVIAKAWKKVLKRVPDAKLFVMGDVIRDSHHKLGDYGIAKENYEKIFIKYIIDKDQKLMSSIKFLGWLNDKTYLYHNMKLAIAKPTNSPETFNVASVEFQAQGIPVIGPNSYSFLEVISIEKPSLLFRREKKIANKIIQILELKNNEYMKLSENVKKFVNEKFNHQKIISQWEIYINSIEFTVDYNPKLIPYSKPIGNNFKWLKILNRKIQNSSKFKFISIQELIERIYSLIAKPMRKFRKTYLIK